MEGEEEVAAVVLAEGQKESEKALLAGSKSNSPHGSLSPKRKVKVMIRLFILFVNRKRRSKGYS